MPWRREPAIARRYSAAPVGPTGSCAASSVVGSVRLTTAPAPSGHKRGLSGDFSAAPLTSPQVR